MPATLLKILKVIAIILVAASLTILTQVGGLVYLGTRFTNGWFARRIASPWKLRLAKWAYQIGIYLIVCFLVVPLIARPLGRVPLPIFGSENLGPLRWYTVLCNRHYVRPALYDATLAVANGMADRFPGTTLHYLDANFPFIDGFPLVPHLSHGDGKKLDLVFCYRDPSTGDIRNGSPSWLGYGVCEGPVLGERDQPALCKEQGQWQYGMLRTLMPKWLQGGHKFDQARTKAMIDLFAAQPAIHKIFIEPHLKTRMGLNSPKIRFHGCQAVRHDDHVHVEVR